MTIEEGADDDCKEELLALACADFSEASAINILICSLGSSVFIAKGDRESSRMKEVEENNGFNDNFSEHEGWGSNELDQREECRCRMVVTGIRRRVWTWN